MLVETAHVELGELVALVEMVEGEAAFVGGSSHICGDYNYNYKQ